MVDVKVVGGLIQQDIIGILSDHHRDHRPLPLPAGQFVDKLIGNRIQLHISQRLVDFFLIFWLQPALTVRKPAEADQLPNRQFHLDIVGLGENRQPLR